MDAGAQVGRFRRLVDVDDDRRVRAWSRHGTSLTPRLGDVASALAEVAAGSTFDGELVVVTDRAAIRCRTSRRSAARCCAVTRRRPDLRRLRRGRRAAHMAGDRLRADPDRGRVQRRARRQALAAVAHRRAARAREGGASRLRSRRATRSRLPHRGQLRIAQGLGTGENPARNAATTIRDDSPGSSRGAVYVSGGRPSAMSLAPNTRKSTAITALLWRASQFFISSSLAFASSPPIR